MPNQRATHDQTKVARGLYSGAGKWPVAESAKCMRFFNALENEVGVCQVTEKGSPQDMDTPGDWGIEKEALNEQQLLETGYEAVNHGSPF